MHDDADHGEAARSVVFACPHGAATSRIAAAWCNRVAPPGWRATSVGITPQATVSAHALRLLAGTPAEGLLDHGLPRPLAAIADPDVVVTIDCPAGAVPGAIGWRLADQEFDAALAGAPRRSPVRWRPPPGPPSPRDRRAGR